MTKKLLFVPVCFVTLFFFYPACKNKKGGSGEAYSLKMRLNKGDKFGQEMDMNMDMDFTVAGQRMAMKMGMKGLNEFEVTSDTPGAKELAMTYKKMDMTMEMNGPNGQIKSPNSNDAARKMVGRTIRLKLNDNNQIIETSGFEEMMADASSDSATKMQMKQMFSNDQMNGLFGAMFQMYPDKPVRVGDTWNKEIEVSVAGVKMKMKGDYELTAVKNGVAFITLNGKYGGKGVMKTGVMELEMDIDGAQKGTYNIGIADGYLKDSDLTMDIKGTMTIMGQKVPLNMKGYILVKGK
jgi:uncharacterized protein DUF6263